MVTSKFGHFWSKTLDIPLGKNLIFGPPNRYSLKSFQSNQSVRNLSPHSDRARLRNFWTFGPHDEFTLKGLAAKVEQLNSLARKAGGRSSSSSITQTVVQDPNHQFLIANWLVKIYLYSVDVEL